MINTAQMSGRIISVNVGKPRTVGYNGRSFQTGIFKMPVEGPVQIRRCNVEGDIVADLRVHGGPYKAVYAYPSEHYSYWTNELALDALEPGAFGENLTTEGLTEETVHIGDQFRVGSAILQVAQPRMPCFKLALKFERSDMVRLFWRSRRSGVYFLVVQEGSVQRGDSIERIAAHPEQVTVADVVRLHTGEEWSAEIRARALRSPLYGSWKRDIQERLVASE